MTKEQKYFLSALAFVKKWEGGLSNHPNDRGGITKFGISRRAHPHLSITDIKNLTWNQAQDIYYREYWQAAGCHLLPWPLCLVVFDHSVMSGVTSAVRMLQRALGATVDGKIGPETLSKVKQPLLIASDIVSRREAVFKRLAKVRPKNAAFLKGWLNRSQALLTESKKGN